MSGVHKYLVHTCFFALHSTFATLQSLLSATVPLRVSRPPAPHEAEVDLAQEVL